MLWWSSVRFPMAVRRRRSERNQQEKFRWRHTNADGDERRSPVDLSAAVGARREWRHYPGEQKWKHAYALGVWVCLVTYPCAEWLLKFGAEEDIAIANSDNCTPMLYACEAGQQNICKWLHEVGAAKSIAKADNGRSIPAARKRGAYEQLIT